ncbi:MAG: cysteine hydrolase, partial [Methanomassiliicoccaceae archaeon]|nr:cysteine hydrolase [Methanomassiliicoccaceae archaeon]
RGETEMKLLIVVDMQNDFITGALGTPQAQSILPDVKAKIEKYKRNGDKVIFTRDTHGEDYLSTHEGRCLPIVHCIKGTKGHEIADCLDTEGCEIIDKPTFGSLELAEHVALDDYDEIELCGVCTDICVVSNALLLKARVPEMEVAVDATCCAGATPESHKAALLTMKMCQVNVTGGEGNVLRE